MTDSLKGRRLGAVIYAPRGTSEDDIPTVDANGRITWVPSSGLTDISAAMSPTYVGPSETFTIPDNRQLLYFMTITVDGNITIGSNSFLILVG